MGGSVQVHKVSGKIFLKFYLDGKQVSIWTNRSTNSGFQSEAHALKALGVIQGEIDKGIFNSDDWKRKKSGVIKSRKAGNDSKVRKTVKSYVTDIWLKQRAQRVENGSLVPRTLKDDRTHLYNYILPKFGDEYLDSIHNRDIDVFKVEIKRSPSGTSNVLGTFQKVMHDAVYDGFLEKAPKFPTKAKKSLQAKHYMNLATQALVLSYIPGNDRFIFMFMMEYGVRPGEGRGLLKTSIANGIVTIQSAFSENKFRPDTKTSVDREQPITKYFQGVLNEMPGNDSKFVFVRSKDGKPYTSKDLNALWHKACADAGVFRFKMYNGIRHSKGRNLLEAGYGYDMVAEVLGHASVDMTRKFYADMPLSRISSALEDLRG